MTGLLLLVAARVDAQASVTRPVVAPAKPVVAPGIAPKGDAGATPGGVRSANNRTISVSARQAAEQTIAALVAAMKNMPKRPPAPPESRTPRARRGDGGSRGLAFDGPTPITYHVTWPASEPEPGVGRRVELDWGGKAAGAPVSLRWNEPTPD
ncbi:MAG TPA: hypothetical protein VFW70_07555 [Methylomirabilota bacterium]|nr:hypothetical protein [Methylomirabilota bacterium]